MESQAAERHRLLKVLETANIKLANVATDVFGKREEAHAYDVPRVAA